MRYSRVLLAVALLAPLGCEGDSPTSTESGTLTIQPANARLAEGESAQLQVDDAPGPVAWTSSRPLLASVDAAGRVTTYNELGTARITATAGGMTGAADVTIEPQCPDPIQIDGTPTLSAEARPMTVTLAADLDVEQTARQLAEEFGFSIVELLPDGFRARLDVPTVAALRCRDEVVALAYPS